MESYDSYHTYINDIDNHKVYTEEDLEKLDARIIAGDNTARKEYIIAYLCLVIYWAKIYKQNHAKIDIMELISVGNVGLIRASETYDPTMGKFITYATSFIRKHINAEIYHRTPVRIPKQKYRLLKKVLAEYMKEHGTEPTTQELANILGMEEYEIITIIQSLKGHSSLNEITEDSDYEPIDFIPAPDNVETAYIEKETREAIIRIINKLNPQYRCVILERYGLLDGIPKTQKEVAEILAITHQRVSQIEKSAIKKLALKLTKYKTY